MKISRLCLFSTVLACFAGYALANEPASVAKSEVKSEIFEQYFNNLPHFCFSSIADDTARLLVRTTRDENYLVCLMGDLSRDGKDSEVGITVREIGRPVDIVPGEGNRRTIKGNDAILLKINDLGMHEPTCVMLAVRATQEVSVVRTDGTPKHKKSIRVCSVGKQ